MWRVRPFSGGQWIVCRTTINLADWLIEHAEPESSFETQLVDMTNEEFDSLPEKQ